MISIVHANEILGVRLSNMKSVSDSRGRFIKFEPDQQLLKNLGSVAFSINPKAGTIRGLHFQVAPFAEEKIVTCVQGSIFDVIIDIRPDSRSFGGVATFELSGINDMQVYLPEGIAHGFQTLTQNTIVNYCMTAKYSPESSFCINPLTDLGITWPIRDFLISDKDEAGLSIELASKLYAESLGH